MEDSHAHHHGAWNQEQLERLMRPERDHLMPRGTVLAEVNAALGSKVADVGAGMGWLTFPLAVAVGESGRVFAIDPSPEGVRAIRQRAQDERLDQIEAMEASAEHTRLPDGDVDTVVWHTMYHDVGDIRQSLRETERILKSGGRFVVVDWDKRETESGPPLQVRVSPEEAEQQIQEVGGFDVVKRWKAGPVTWGLTFEKH